MIRSIASVGCMRGWCVLLVCCAMEVSSTLYAQARPPVPEPPIGVTIRPQDQLSRKEMWDANPCFRRRTNSGKDMEVYWRTAWILLCVERERSLAVTQAWAKGLDEHGNQLDADRRAKKLAEMETWLRRLVGKYRIDGKYWNSGGTSTVQGSAECFGVGGGPGVSCVLSPTWKAPKETHKDKRLDKALEIAMQPLVLLFGMDPGASQIRVTMVDFRAVGKSGPLIGGAVMFEGRPNFEHTGEHPLVTYTWQYSRVAAKPGGDLDMKFVVFESDIFQIFYHQQPIEIDLQLHRVRPVDAENPRAAP